MRRNLMLEYNVNGIPSNDKRGSVTCLKIFRPVHLGLRVSEGSRTDANIKWAEYGGKSARTR